MKREKALKELASVTNVRFDRFLTICRTFFDVRDAKGSHIVVSLPDGTPYAIQSGGGKAKPYQVRAIIKAIESLEEKEE